jgi:hypothetical protein
MYRFNWVNFAVAVANLTPMKQIKRFHWAGRAGRGKDTVLGEVALYHNYNHIGIVWIEDKADIVVFMIKLFAACLWGLKRYFKNRSLLDIDCFLSYFTSNQRTLIPSHGN